MAYSYVEDHDSSSTSSLTSQDRFGSDSPSTSPPTSPVTCPCTSPQPVELSSHFEQEPSFWEPYVPLSACTPTPNASPNNSAEEIFERHKLPFNLLALEEADQMGVAYAFETQAILASEVGLAERRYRQQIIIAKAYELQFLKAQQQLKKLNAQLDLTVIAALKKVAPVTTPSSHDDPGCRYLDLQSHCPDALRLPACVQSSGERCMNLGLN